MDNELDREKQNRSLMENIVLGVAHELNNPNTFVRMNTMTLKKMISLLSPCFDEYAENHPEEKFGPYTLPELRSKMSKLLEDTLGATVRIITISDKLKQCSSFSLDKATEISLAQVVQGILDMHKYLLEQMAKVEFIYPEYKSFTLKGHQLQLEQALSIILTNACDAIQERFGLSPDDKKGKIKIVLEEQDNDIIVKFSDNGCGMSDDVKSKIFDPYFSTKPQGVGDGLGMALCKAIIDRHGGSIVVKSKVNEGTEIEIKLPKDE